LLLNYPATRTQEIFSLLTKEKTVTLTVLRLDEIHPVVSGNKIFKLHYFLDKVKDKTVVTFGGAYSNHLVAAAFACKQKSIDCIGIVRGEEPKQLSHTLQRCIEYGMHLRFISRDEYDKKETEAFITELQNTYGDCSIIPEGGYGSEGALGASLIAGYIADDVTHICCAVGTATTVAGLLLNKKLHQKIIAFPVLKGMDDIEQRIEFLTGLKFNSQQLQVENNYHFGGYAKKTGRLISFMNDLYNEHTLPTDFVYTGKMMYGVMDMIEKDFFAPGCKICCVHTGGLQGNLSLPKNTLTF
jgi:1-aminocyclopropane-1-carboxylate deaminase